MKINPYNKTTYTQPNFKANYYKVQKYGQATAVYVMTDNAENLGTMPVLIDRNDRKEEMVYDGRYYITRNNIPPKNYKILYEDTGKYENNGKERILNKDKINQAIKSGEKPQNFALMKGNAKGLLVHSRNVDKKLRNSDTPLIIICDDDNDVYKSLYKAEGIILKSGSNELLSHFSALCRNYFSFGHLISVKSSLAELSKFEGKFISISNEGESLEYQEISPITKGAQTEEKIIVPKMRRVEKILSLDECEKDTVGNKAYNLKRMTNLVKEGKLEDVIIPNAFVLPFAYLEKVENSIAENSKNRFKKDNKVLLEIKEFAQDIITDNKIMVRSAFNGEDLEGYSAAGLYDSYFSYLNDLELNIINKVIQSKNKPIAIKSRERHGIPHEDIKPGVIIQNCINSDYSFTTYTESPFDKNKLLIELYITENRYCKPEPYQITYDRKNGKIAVEQEHSLLTEYLLDENYNLLKTTPLEKSHLEKLLPILKKLVKNALVLEREFGKPQDIEGGIKDGQLYLWQTRNIVKKVGQA